VLVRKEDRWAEKKDGYPRWVMKGQANVGFMERTSSQGVLKEFHGKRGLETSDCPCS
jgi:hypothetical protein